MLVDTSVWIEHLRRGSAALADSLEHEQVWSHPFVIGELACGNIAQRGKVLALLADLPCLPLAGHGEVLAFVESRRLMGRGLGWIDMHLLASATLASVPLWTQDKRLAGVAAELGLRGQTTSRKVP